MSKIKKDPLAAETKKLNLPAQKAVKAKKEKPLRKPKHRVDAQRTAVKSAPDEWEDASSTMFRFENEGDRLEGMLDGFADLELDTGVCRAYYVQTDNLGRLSFIGGYQIDDAIEKHDIVNGDILRITFKGKLELTSGKSVNMYDIKFKKGIKPIIRS